MPNMLMQFVNAKLASVVCTAQVQIHQFRKALATPKPIPTALSK